MAFYAKKRDAIKEDLLPLVKNETYSYLSLYYLGRNALEQKDYDEAMKYFEQAEQVAGEKEK